MNPDEILNPRVLGRDPVRVFPKCTDVETKTIKAKNVKKTDGIQSITERTARYYVVSAPANAELMLQDNTVDEEMGLLKLFENSTVRRKNLFKNEAERASKRILNIRPLKEHEQDAHYFLDTGETAKTYIYVPDQKVRHGHLFYEENDPDSR